MEITKDEKTETKEEDMPADVSDSPEFILPGGGKRKAPRTKDHWSTQG